MPQVLKADFIFYNVTALADEPEGSRLHEALSGRSFRALMIKFCLPSSAVDFCGLP